eukprot:365754-Chlamydomonas_euryale.AAC.11
MFINGAARQRRPTKRGVTIVTANLEVLAALQGTRAKAAEQHVFSQLASSKTHILTGQQPQPAAARASPSASMPRSITLRSLLPCAPLTCPCSTTKAIYSPLPSHDPSSPSGPSCRPACSRSTPCAAQSSWWSWPAQNHSSIQRVHHQCYKI